MGSPNVYMKAVHLLLPLLFSFLFALWTHKEELADNYAIYDDSAIYYVLRAQINPGSMGNDLLVRALGLGAVSGVGGMPVLSGFLLPVEKAAAQAFGLREMLLLKSIALQTATGALALALGRALGFGGWSWGFLAVFMAYFASMDVFSGGLHRQYGPLLCLALYYCAEKSRLAGALAVSAGFYALYGASFPFSCCVVMLMLSGSADAKYRRYGWILLAFFAAAPFILRSLRPEIIAGINGAFSWKGGFNADGLLSPEVYLFSVNEHSVLYRWLTWGLFTASGCAFLLYRAAGRKIPRGDKLFFGAMGISFVWAYLVTPAFSSRQVIHSLPLLLAIFPFRFLVSQAPGQLRVFALWGMAVLPLFSLACWERRWRYITRVSPVVMRALDALPQNSLVFAHPATAGLIGFFTGRSSYSNDEWEGILCGFNRGSFCEEARSRNLKVFDIYYCASPAEVAGFAAASGVTHFIVEERFYLPDYLEGRGLYSNFTGRSAQALAAGGRALLDLAQKKGVKLESGAYLLETERLKVKVSVNPLDMTGGALGSRRL